jgi:hypothetical protein
MLMIVLTDANGIKNAVDEGESATITAVLKDGAEALNKAAIESLRLTLYHTVQRQILNGRNNIDIEDANGGTLATNGTLTLILKGVTLAFTADAGTDELTATSHGLENGNAIKFASSGTIPGGLNESSIFWVVNKTTNTLQVATTVGGVAVDITSAGSGVHKFRAGDNLMLSPDETETHSALLEWSWNNGSSIEHGSEELRFTVAAKPIVKSP